MEKLTLTVEETAQLLDLSRSLTYEAVRNGTIPSIKIGRRYLIPKQGIERMLDIQSNNAIKEN
ncbi:MAG TPA: helix-turn-helix domain-containing protein [Treponema sp.]|jgi:excisionase family DNA binding protein|nr:helix-turn-helix domain-containing protein [Treponema sp.]